MDKNIIRCGIVNFWWCENCGAGLTAFALSKFLSTRIENCEPTLLMFLNNPSFIKRTHNQNFEFVKKNVPCSETVYIYEEDFKGINDLYDCFILGSDQVFRLEWVPDSWFFPYIDYSKNMLAVSASFGIDKINNSKSRIKGTGKLLTRFNNISLRELGGQDVFKKYFKNVKAPSVILDPVFLIDRNDYVDTVPSEKIDELKDKDFVFAYVLDETENTKSIINQLEDEGHTVIQGGIGLPTEDFIAYISSAKYVITDSFHGVCFSTIFEKDFICLYNKFRGQSRIESIRTMLNLPDDCFAEKIEDTSFLNQHVDYAKLQTNMAEKVSYSANWIIDNVTNPAKKKGKSKVADKLQVKSVLLTNKAVLRIIRLKIKIKKKINKKKP